MGKTFHLQEAQQALAATPVLLRAWLERLPPSWLELREKPDTWSPREIVAHLIEGELTDWMVRVRQILAGDSARPFQPFDRTGHEANSVKDIAELLDELEQLRAANLQELENLGLGPDDLEREGLHPELGPVTLGNLLATWVVHDQDHIAQITRILARAQAENVGPWDHPNYLGILHRLLPRDRDAGG